MITLTDVMQVEGMVTTQEAAALMRLAGDVDAKLAILEIGTYRGRTAVALAAGALAGQGAKVWTVDAYDPYEVPIEGGAFIYPPDSKDAARRAFERLGLNGQITQIAGASLDVAKGWKRKLGLLFLDGRHDEESVAADASAWLKHVAAGGVLALHDRSEPGVAAVLATLARLDGWERLDDVFELAILRRTA